MLGVLYLVFGALSLSAGTCVDLTRTLALDSEGSDVSRLQEFLRDIAGYRGTISGHVGPLSVEALKRWQLQKGIVASSSAPGAGTTGPVTRAAMAFTTIVVASTSASPAPSTPQETPSLTRTLGIGSRGADVSAPPPPPPPPPPAPAPTPSPITPSNAESVRVLNANSTNVATLFIPRAGIQPSEIAVLVNDNDPQSVEVGNYYQQKRGIPSKNMIHLNFDQNKVYPGIPANNNGIDPAEFATLKAQVDAALGPEIQALAISWTTPFRIANFNYYPTNYSITSAFTHGIDSNYVNSHYCTAMPASAYYDSNSTRPYTDFKIRPAMMLAGDNVEDVKSMIDRGLLADRNLPTGDGWFVRTADAARSNPRYLDFQSTVQSWNRPEALAMNYNDYAAGKTSIISNTQNILFYLTGAADVPNIHTNTYVPGAVADHLTSAGGVLIGSSQMNILRWLEAGAAASYGTVTEPCNFRQKFPQAAALVKNYFLGNTVVEAYSKSVHWPAQGVFVGDPLARPFGTRATLVNGTLTVTTTSLEPGATYALYAAQTSSGPFTQVATKTVPAYQFTTITVSGMSAPFYKLEKTFEP